MSVLVYNGEPGAVRLGDYPLRPGDTITDPQLIDHLGARSDFELAQPQEEKPKRKSAKAKE